MKLLLLGLMMASWYGQGDAGGTWMANGKRYNENAPTCAHKTYPFGTKLIVTNKSNGKTTVCTVTDRGPYVKGRVIDLSKKGAIELGMLSAGVASVTISSSPQNLAALQLLKEPCSDCPGDVGGRHGRSGVTGKSPKRLHSTSSQHHGKHHSQGRYSHPSTKPLSAWQETLRNLHSI